MPSAFLLIQHEMIAASSGNNHTRPCHFSRRGSGLFVWRFASASKQALKYTADLKHVRCLCSRSLRHVYRFGLGSDGI